MPAYEDRLEQAFSLKHFLVSLAFVALVYLVFIGYAVIMQDRTMMALESRLAIHTVAVERPARSAPPPALAAKVETPAPSAKDAEEKREESLSPIQSSTKPLPPAPVEGMTEASEFGELPLPSKDGKTPFAVYRRTAPINRDRPMLAVALEDYGLSESLSDTVLKDIPAEVSLILNPYSAQPDLWQKKARENGHEIWLRLFTVTKSFPFRDPGAKGLLADASLKYNQERLHWALGRTTGYAGIAAFTDSAMSSGAPVFQTLAKDIFRRGLGYLEMNPGRDSFLMPLAIDAKAPNTEAAFALDTSGAAVPDTTTIEKHIRDHGGALVTIRATPGNVKFLKAWLPRMKDRGISIVPASALAEIGREE